MQPLRIKLVPSLILHVLLAVEHRRYELSDLDTSAEFFCGCSPSVKLLPARDQVPSFDTLISLANHDLLTFMYCWYLIQTVPILCDIKSEVENLWI